MFRLSKAAIAEGMPLDGNQSVELRNPWHAIRALKRIRAQRACLELCTDALTTATASLRLLSRPEDRYLLDRMQTESKKETYDDDDEDGLNFHSVSESRDTSRESGGRLDPRTGNLIGNPGDAPLKLKVVWLSDVDAKLVLLRCRLALLARQERVARYNARLVASASDDERRRGQFGSKYSESLPSPSHRGGTKRSYAGGPIDIASVMTTSTSTSTETGSTQPFLPPAGFSTDSMQHFDVSSAGVEETLLAIVQPAVDTGCVSLQEFELAIELVMKHSMGDRDATGGAGLSYSASSSSSSSSSHRVKMLEVAVRSIASALVRTRKRKVEAGRSMPPVTAADSLYEEDDETFDGIDASGRAALQVDFAETYLLDAKTLEATMTRRISRLETLLKGILRRLDGIETNLQLHHVAADAMLTEDARVGLPTWLVQSFKGGVGSLRFGSAIPFCCQETFGIVGAKGVRVTTHIDDDDEVMSANPKPEHVSGSEAVPNTISEISRLSLVTVLSGFAKAGGHPTSLIEVYLAHGRLADACDVASSVLADILGSLHLRASSLANAPTDTLLEVTHLPDAFIPHRLFDRLLDSCDEILNQ